MLASLLYPYDDDARDLISVWLDELDREGCVRFYRAGEDTYLEVCNWLKHQKVDKPSASKIPPFAEASRIFAKPRERSSEDQGPKDQGRDQGPRTKDLPVGTAKPSNLPAVNLSLVKANGHGHKKLLFDHGLPWLCGVYHATPIQIRPFIGKCLKALKDDSERLWQILVRVQSENVADPKSRITEYVQSSGKNKNGFAELIASGDV